MASIVWLASYPKSGNTWLRAVLTNYLQESEQPASINSLLGGPIAADRELFNELLGLDSADMTRDEVMRYRPQFHETLAGEAPPPAFIKVHEAFLHLPCGAAVFPKAATAGVIYLVRSPLDVAVSYAHHHQRSIDATIEWMNNPTAMEAKVVGGMCACFPELLLTWSGHVSSWLDQRELPLHVLCYEDMQKAPMAAFGAVLRFAGLETDEARLAQAIERAAFPRLHAQEEQFGFAERQPTAPSFFRTGVAGSWRSALSAQQVRALAHAHGPVMERLGYLREAEAFLAKDA